MELRDVVDGTSSTGSLEAEINDGGGGGGGGSSVTLHSHLKRRESVARMTWDGLSYLASAVSRLRQPGSTSYDHHDVRSRSVPSTMNMRIRSETTSAAPIAQPSTSLPPDVTMDTGGNDQHGGRLVGRRGLLRFAASALRRRGRRWAWRPSLSAPPASSPCRPTHNAPTRIDHRSAVLFYSSLLGLEAFFTQAFFY